MLLKTEETVQMGCFRRGDIVWARAVYPISWWPALVLRTDIFGVLVSFFDSYPPPRYFLESQLCSFSRNFRSLVQTVQIGTPCDEILNRALTLLARRANLSLKCSCQEPPEANNLADLGWDCEGQALEAANRFLPAEALGFVLGTAVSPWIEDEELVVAVTASAEIKRFRRYCTVKRKLMYREGRVLEEDTVTNCVTNTTNMEGSLEPLHEVEVNCPQLKKRVEVVQPSPVQPCLKLRKTKPFFSLSRAYAYLQKNGDPVKIDLFDAFSPGSLSMFDVPLLEHTSQYSSIVEIDNFQERKENFDIINDGTTRTSYVSMLKPQGSTGKSKDNYQKCKSDVEVRGSAKGGWGVDVQVGCISRSRRPSASQLLLKNVLGNHSSNDAVCGGNVVTTKGLLLPHLSTDEFKTRCRNSHCATSIANNGEVNIVSPKERNKENKVKELHQHDAADISLNSQLNQQPKVPESSHSTTLHMKFPKGYYVPSKEELVRKFTSFGSVDPLNTKVSPYTGAAKVVFLNHIDAMTAYEYAKRKKVFRAQVDVRFWL